MPTTNLCSIRRSHRGKLCIAVVLFCAIVLLCSIQASLVWAQLPTATILGVVRDSSGAVVPDATLAARNVGTGQTRTVVSDAGGAYRLSALQVGNYEIQVEHPGFKMARRTGLTLAVGQEALVDFVLEVGAVAETVEVTAEAPLVNTTSGAVGSLMGGQTVADLPLNGRNYIDLALLQPGVSEHKNRTSGAGFSGKFLSVGGAPLRSNSFLLDGANMASYHGAASSSQGGTTLGVEGIREWRLVTNSYSAEYGLTMGGQMEIVSKSGTNTFHGSLLEYHRNSALDARNFFDRKSIVSTRRLPGFTRNNFGGSVGGPIVRNKTFFHTTYEGLRERLGVTRIIDVIPPEYKVDGGLVPGIAPVIKPLLTLFPDPNLPNHQFTSPGTESLDENYGQVRIDHAFSEASSLFGRYTIDDAEKKAPREYPQFKDPAVSRSQFATLSENHVFSPNLLNTFRISYSRTMEGVDSLSGIIGPEFSFVPGLEIGGITVGGMTDFTKNRITPVLPRQNIFTWSDDLFYSRGRHALKFGTLVNRYQQYILSSVYRNGEVRFANFTTFLLARPITFNAMTPGSISDRTFHHTTVGFYVQDDLRVGSNLTLNLGLRYEFRTDYNEVRGRGASLRDLRRDAAPTLGRTVRNPSLRNVSPRFGFAWNVTGDSTWALRGGAALLYDTAMNLGTAFFLSASGSPPFSSASQVQNPPSLSLPFVFPPEAIGKSLDPVDFNMEQPHMLHYNLTVERQLPFGMGLRLAYAGSRGFNLMHMTEGNPTVPQTLPDGRKFWTGNEPRINPNWDRMRLITAAGNSWYNSFQFGLTKRLSKGLQFQSSYTWSKLVDEGQGQTPGETTQTGSSVRIDPENRIYDRGLAAFDVAHTWNFNAIYRLPQSPQGGALGKLLNGWWVSTILTLQSGTTFNPQLTRNRSRSQVMGTERDRPDRLRGRSLDSVILGGPDRYFDPTAFATQPAGFLGTSGRNILRGPGLATLNFTLAKDTALGFLGESGKLEFRAEFFNLLNRANFGLPNITAFAGLSEGEAPLPDVGRIRSTTTTSRQIQLALKILF